MQRVHAGHGKVQREEKLRVMLVHRLVRMAGNAALEIESGAGNVVLFELAGPLDGFDSQEGQPQNQGERQIDDLLLALAQSARRVPP